MYYYLSAKIRIKKFVDFLPIKVLFERKLEVLFLQKKFQKFLKKCHKIVDIYFFSAYNSAST